MRLVFMGSPDFAVPALRALVNAGHEVVAVYCQPPRPAGRGHNLQSCPVQTAAEALGLPVRTPAKLRGNAEALAQAPVPDEAETADFRRRLAQAQALRQQASELLAAKTREAERLKAEAAAAASAADLLGDEAR